MPGKVPLLIYGKGKDRVKTFDEFSVKKGKLKNFTPKKVWSYVFKS
jgi:2,3-bisphosphoglycerate-independent phosphoglycerate mutase